MMENKNFDEELKSRIKQVFEDYEDETVDAGWNRLREKYPQKKQRDYIFWWLVSAAALLLVACLFYFFRFETVKTNSVKIVKQQKTATVPVLHQADSSRQVYATVKKFVLKKSISASSNTKKTWVKTVSVDASRVFADAKEARKEAATPPENPLQTKTVIAQRAVFTGIKEASVGQTKQLFAAATQIKMDSAQQKQKPAVAQFPAIALLDSSQQKQRLANEETKQSFAKATKMDSTQQKQPLAKTAKPAVKKTFAQKAATETVKKLSEKVSKFSFGLYVGTHLNYANGSNNQLGLGAGFLTDFRLGKNLKFSTGLGLMQNKLSYNHNISNGSLLAASSYYTVSLPSSTTIVQNPTLSRLDARLLALDIPLNLTYTILPDKNSIALSAGISSSTFVKETYNYQYSNSTVNTQTIKSFNNFDFAKTLNIAADFAYPLGKNKLQIEPFLKYPLGGVGSQQLKFGSVGVNLKLNLQSLKK